jgi:M6 family metalloprotease-like protein
VGTLLRNTMFFLLAFYLIQTNAVFANQANPEAMQTLKQPDGVTFTARLIGDELAHWYETEDGYTVVRNEDGYWSYAERNSLGNLVPSQDRVGLNSPSVEQHLRENDDFLQRMYAKKDILQSENRSPSIESITGTHDAVIILVEFSDSGTGEGSAGSHDDAYFSDSSSGLILGSNNGKLADYLDEVSYGQFDLQGVVANDTWHRSDRTELYFGADCAPGQPCDADFDVPTATDNCNTCIYDLVRNAVQMADTTGFDFSIYDDDSNGIVDHVIVVHAGDNQASLSGAADDIWSHWGVIPEGGEPVDGVAVENYMLVSEWDLMSVLAHEFGHELGAPDLYDYDGDSDPVGRWCSMGYSFETERPPHFCGLLKVDIDADFSNGQVGWVVPTPLDTDSTYTVARLDENQTGSVYISAAPFSGSEYYLLENRSRAGYYDYSVPESGIVFTHVDMAMPDGTGRFNDGDPSNTYHGAWIERPLGLASSDGAAYSADDGEHVFNPTSIPNTNANGNVGTGKVFWGITAEDDAMDVSFRGGPTFVSGTTTGNTLWTADQSPYVMNGDLTVSAGDTLEIEPGVVVKLSGGDRHFYINGTLLALGTESNRIIITSYADDEYGGDTNNNGPSTGASGDWEFINFIGAGAGGEMSHCLVRYGGNRQNIDSWNNDYKAIWLSGGTSLTISNSVVENTYYSDYRNRYYAAIFCESGTSLDVSDCDITNNESRGIWTSGNLTVLKSRIQDNGNIGILGYGSGNSISNSTITGNGSTGIYQDGSNCTVTNCRITDNGADGLRLVGSSSVAYADTVSGNARYGINCSSSTSEFHDNVITNNGDWGALLSANFVDRAWSDDAQLSGNGRNNGIYVYSGSIDSNTTWLDEHLYTVAGDITVTDGVTWTLEPGAIFKFNNGDLHFYVYGTMIANGTESDRIIFTSFSDDEHGGDTNNNGPSNGSPGDWEFIKYDDADAGCAMTHCVVRYGGNRQNIDSWNNDYKAIWLTGGSSLTLANSVVENTYYSDYRDRYYAALFCESGTNLDISDCDIRNNGSRGIWSSGNLNVQNSRIQGNGHYGIYGTGNNNTITNSTVTGNGSHGVRLNGSSCSVTGCRITDNSSYGLYMSGLNAIAVEDTLLSNAHGLGLLELPTEFHDNIAAGNNICAFILPALILTEAWHSGNEVPAGETIGVWAGNIPAGTQWIDEYTIHVYGDLTIPHNNDLTLEAGSVLKFSNYYGLTVNGTLIANGTSADNIVFTSYYDDDHAGDTNHDGESSGTKGDWRNIAFSNTNTGSSMQYCQVRYAGRYHGSSNYYREAVTVDGTASLTMTNCLVEETGGGSNYPYAVRIDSGAHFQLIDSEIRNNANIGLYSNEPNALILNTSSHDNGSFGFYVCPDLIGEIANTDTMWANGWGNSLGVISGNVIEDDYWPATYTYVFNGSPTINAGATVTIDKGAVLKFNGNRSITVNGGLVAQGDAVEKVVFTSFKDDNYGGDTNLDGVNSIPSPGDWGQIRFDGAHSGSLLNWAVVSYGGYSNVPALQFDNCIFSVPFTECIIRDNLARGVRVGANAELFLNNSDLYSNGYGLENLNTVTPVDARGNWWGHVSGPSGVASGLGDAVSENVLYDPWLNRSIDNPWVAFTSPATSGNYTDVIIFDLDGDSLLDLIAGTESDGLEIYQRTGFEEWAQATSPISDGQILALDKTDLEIGEDVNGDGFEDLLVATPTGLRVFTGDGAGALTEVSAPLAGPGVSDAKFAFVDHDTNLDIVATSADNGGVWVFYGTGDGYWTTGNRPVMTNTYNKVATRDLNNDTWLDIVATNAEYLGIHIWYGASDSTWTAGDPIDDGQAFFGLDVGDINKDGYYDIAAGSDASAIGITCYLNDQAGSWTPLDGPTTTGRFGDIILADLNGDNRLDLAAANLFEGINVWIGTSSLHWNYWYHPASTNIYKAICVDDFTLNGSLDLASASTVHGMALWDNLTPGFFQEYFELTPDNIDFGEVAIGNCAHTTFDLKNNTEADTLHNVVVYTTNDAFSVAEVGREVGPIEMLLPQETRTIQVTYCPTEAVPENEVVIIHSTQSVTHLRMTAEGVELIEPIWAVDLDIANATGGEGNSAILTFGAAIGATDSLDVQSGESGLPPVPPSTVFDARFPIPGTEGSLINIHDYYNIDDAFTLQWQPGDDGYPITVSWDSGQLPTGTFLIGTALKDTLDMALVDEYVIPTGMEYITELTVWTSILSTHTYDLHESWQLVSRPISTPNDSLDVLFPSATSAFSFLSGSYLQAHLLTPGEGYWLDMPADTTVQHTGEQVRRIQLSLPAGWSLIGAPYDTFTVANVAQTPPGVIQSVYGFGVNYQLAAELIPGQGYWVDLSAPGEITIDLDAFKRMAIAGDETGMSPSLMTAGATWEMPIIVQSCGDINQNRELQIGVAIGATDAIDQDLGESEVPPLPPSHIFEARLIGANGNGQYRDLRDADAETLTYQITWQGKADQYPLKLTWNADLLPADCEAIVTDTFGGEILSPVDMKTQNSLIIDGILAESGAVKIELTLAGAASGLPRVLALYPNKPNPFNPSTSIRFDLPRTGIARIQLYDVAGRLVRVLHSGAIEAGSHEVVWDGRDLNGNQVPSGTYFYHLSSQDMVLTRKMLLVK